jgi:hypothetical protein
VKKTKLPAKAETNENEWAMIDRQGHIILTIIIIIIIIK